MKTTGCTVPRSRLVLRSTIFGLSLLAWSTLTGCPAAAPDGSGTGGKAAGSGGSGSGGVAQPGTGGANVPSGTGGAASTGGTSGGTGGTSGGTGGSMGSGGQASGTGGAASTGGTSGGTGGGTGGSAVGSGGQVSGTGGVASTGGNGGVTSSACPANATFCSGFEDANQPAGSVYNVQGAPGLWTRDFAIDTTIKKNGNSALRVKSAAESGTSGSAYKMLSVPGPATGNAFWARFWFRSDVDFGGDHNPFAMACPDDVADKSNCIEFAEDVGIAFNTSDVVVWPAGFGRTASGGTNPYTLPKNTWHCIQLSFDAGGKIQQAYLGDTLLIDATNYPTSSLTLKRFKFGFWSLHGPNRQIWYDDVVVAPTRIGCS